MDDEVLTRFSAATRAWFTARFDAPTSAQTQAWKAISGGDHTLVVAPTGSGKTLAAFLWALDRLTTDPRSGCRVLYISPLRALAVDVERNLRVPLAGIAADAERLGLPRPQVRVAVRSGDTPTEERRAFARRPSDILITTPESLFLLLTSAARDALTSIDTVIIDEVHALAGTKRGAHLALSLERLDALLARPAQRIGLSATVRPIEEVARFLASGRPVTQVCPPSQKRWDLSVVVPVADLAQLDAVAGSAAQPTQPPSVSSALRAAGSSLASGEPPKARPSTQPSPINTAPRTAESSLASGEPPKARLSTQPSSIWPAVEERIADAIAAHRSTLVFVNSRRLAERLTARLNEIWVERTGTPPDEPRPTSAARSPAEVMAQSAISNGAPPILARAHHGSVSREQRQLIETELKAGRLPAVVATSSLELGIDMGAIDLVIQVEAPPSVASGLQRVGRAGHQVGAVSRGLLFPKFRGDLVQTTVTAERMRDGQIEALHLPANPLDVLAQQIVAMVAMDDLTVAEVEALAQRAAPFATLTRPVLEAVLDMLAGRYPSEEFAELRPRLNWDRNTGLLTARSSAQRLAVTSGGTIPDRGLFGVFIAGEEAGRRVGELDEEMVYESRVGDVIALGTSSWRITEITHDQVQVAPAPGQAARLPFWKGDSLGRPAELGRAVGAFVRELAALPDAEARTRLTAIGLDEWACDNLLSYLDEQAAAIRQLPHDRQLVVERFRDELGDWRVVVHSPYGAAVHAPWALLAAARLRERYGVDVQAMHADDGLIFRLPDTAWDEEFPGDGLRPGSQEALTELLELIFPEPAEVAAQVRSHLGGSAVFASRFRECAGRALLLPNRRPGKRQALWQQRLRASQLLEVASSYPEFPIVLEAVRECVSDVFDVPALEELMRAVQSREVATLAVETPHPSPFAMSLQYGYVAQFLYEGDAPLAERRAAALTLDQSLLADLLGSSEAPSLADLLDPDALTATERELQHLTPNRKARDREDVADLLRSLGPLTTAQVAARSQAPDQAEPWLSELAAQGWVLSLPGDRWVVAEDAARVRDGLGVPLPSGIADAFLAEVADPLADLVSRFARTHTVFTAAQAASHLGIGVAGVKEVLRRLVAARRIVEGDLRPREWRPAEADPASAGGPQLCDASVLRLLRRRSLAALRHGVEPVGAADFAAFLPSWQGTGQRHGVEGVLRTIEQLAGVPMPASALESLVLPSRVTDYTASLLDELTATGEVLWQGHGAIGPHDGWVSLHPSSLAHLTLHEPTEPITDDHAALLETIGAGGHFFSSLLAAGQHGEGRLAELLWELVWAGRVTNDSFAGLRALLKAGTTTHRSKPAAARPRYRPSLTSAALVRRAAPAHSVGRWSALPAREPDATVRTVGQAELLLDRYGVLTRDSVASEEVAGGFAAIYRVLAAAEDAGRLRRGYFVEGLGASQFAGAGAVDRLRADTARSELATAPKAVVFAAADPANPYGAALAWPSRDHAGHQPGRKAGAVVVLVGGNLVLYVERGGRTVLSWPSDDAVVEVAASTLADAVRRGVLGTLTVATVDGESALGSSSPTAKAMTRAGFAMTPRGLRLRP